MKIYRSYISYVCLLLCFLLIQAASFSQPSISGFTPLKGTPGTVVTINGNGFSATASSNHVWFGKVRAEVTSASSNQLTVKVPAGASNQHTSISVSNLVVTSSKQFIVPFSGAATDFTRSSVEYLTSIDTVENIETTNFITTDLDMDGRIDVGVVDRLINKVSFYRNTLQSGKIIFVKAVELVAGNTPRFINYCDLDGDGKPDVVVSNILSDDVYIFRNTSTVGNISFADKIIMPASRQPAGISFGDLDKDGRNEILVNSIGLEGFVTILKNNGNMNFQRLADLKTAGGSIYDATVADLDGDGLLDIALPNVFLNAVSIFRNITSGATIQFSPVINIPTNAYPDRLRIEDLNDDGKPEMMVSYYVPGNSASVFRNISKSGNISFDNKQEHFVGFSVDDIAMEDMNGDGVKDLIASGFERTIIKKNLSISGGPLTFGNEVVIPIFWNGPIQTADIDNDGKQDLCYESGMFRVSIFRNRADQAQIVSVDPAIAGKGTEVTIKGVKLINTNSVSFGGVPAQSFSIVNDTEIKAIVGDGASDYVLISTATGRDSIGNFEFVPAPVINQFSPASGGKGTVVTISGSYLKHTTSVLIGGKPAQIQDRREDQLIVIVDSIGLDAVTTDIRIQTPGGIATLSGFQYLPPPSITSFTPTSGNSGTTIVIKGKNFTGTDHITLGGIKIFDFTLVDDGEIQVKVPYNSSGEITVVGSNGVGRKPGFTFTGPVLSSFSPAEAKSGTVITLTGKNLSQLTKIYFGDVVITDFQSVTETEIRVLLDTAASGIIRIEAPLGVAEKDGFIFYPRPIITSYSPNNVNKGTLVVLKGKNLDLVPTVKFGGVEATEIIIISKEEIRARVGEGSSGNIDLNTNGGDITVPGFLFRQTPIITGISAISGAVNNIITINGNHFNPVAGNNVVYIGGMRAIVESATDKSLRVRIPKSAASGQWKVTVNGLTAAWHKTFVVTYPNGQNVNSATFKNRKDINTVTWPANLRFADLDGDGKQDMLINGYTDYNMDIFKNTSVLGTVSFEKVITIARPDKWRLGFITEIVDMDADGKQDLVVHNPQSRTLQIYKNNSVPGELKFDEVFETATAFGAFAKMTDLDLDGKPDLVYSSGFYETKFFVQRNASIDGVIAFEPVIVFSTGETANDLSVDDLNGDNKPDVVIAHLHGKNISVMKNISVQGKIEFEYPLFLNTNVNTPFARTSDVDGDGKPEVLAGIDGKNPLYIYRNTSTENLSFAEPFLLDGEAYMVTVGSGDTNGDGKLDIITNEGLTSSLDVFQNTSTPGSFSFRQKVSFSIPNNAGCVEVVDLDGDGRPEMAATLYGSFVVCIFHNEVVTGIDPIPASQLGIKLYPNPNDGRFRIEGLKLSDKWETCRIVNAEGKEVAKLSVKNKEMLNMNLKLANGNYIVLLERRNNRPVLMRFVKK